MLPQLHALTCSSGPYCPLAQVGKTTLIKGLIKHYTRQDVREVKGPITLIAGKARRLCFIECPQDLSAMIDAGRWRGGCVWECVVCR